MEIATPPRLFAAPLITPFALGSPAHATRGAGKGGDGHTDGATHDAGGVTDGHADDGGASRASGAKGKGPKYKGGNRKIGHADDGGRIADVVFRGHCGQGRRLRGARPGGMTTATAMTTTCTTTTDRP